MFAVHHIAQLERLVQLVIGFVRLIIENDVNVIAFAGRRIFVRHVAFKIAAEIEFDFNC